MKKYYCKDCNKKVANKNIIRCKKCSDKKLIKNLFGKKFGYMTIVNKTKKIQNHRYWLCKCECGNKKFIRIDWIQNNKNLNCGCKTSKLMRKSHIDNYGEQSKKELFRNYKRLAKIRNLSFKLKYKTFLTLTQQNCYYCGLSPKQIMKSKNNNGDYIYNGLDRLNNNQGYTLQNSVPCCKQCNWAKVDLSKEKFLNWINKVYLYNRFQGKHKQYSMILGRFQCKPHKGHQGLINQLLKEGKNILIVLRKEDKSEKNPYTIEQRKTWFKQIYKKEIKNKRIRIIGCEDVIEIVYGRKPGWGIREVRLSKKLEDISGTKMREENEKTKNK